MADDTPLTRREAEILGLLAEGLSNDEIAARLVISPNTVKVHVRNIFEKMDVQSRTEATMEAVRRGWINVPGLELAPAGPQPPAWPPLEAVWRPWQTAALAAALVVAVLVALWPNQPPAQLATTITFDFTTDLGLSRTTPLPRQEVARWTPRVAMPTARSRAAAGVVDGRLYVVGGETPAGDTAALEMYDPALDVWQSLPPRPVAARAAAAAALDERLVVAGGCARETALDRVDVFDPSTGLWTQAAALPAGRCGLALVALEGRLYAIGGWDGAAVTATLFIYDPAAGMWQEGAGLPEPRAFAGAVVLRQNIYLLGGHDGGRQRAEMWAYDPGEGDWRPAPPLPEARAGLVVAAEGTSIYALGGGQGVEPPLRERFDLTAQAWSTIESPRVGPWHHAIGAIIGPNLHVAGGWSGDYLAAHEVYQASHLLFLPLGAQGAR